MRHDAIFNTHPNVVRIDGDDIAYDRADNVVKLNVSRVQEEELRLEAEYQSTQYQRDRARRYPPLTELADALYWQAQGDNTKMTAYLAAVDAVKTKYPKGNE
jgi:hypothetical protein